MAEKLLSCFRRRRTNRSNFKRSRRRRTNRSNFNAYSHGPKEKVFEATKSADAVLLNEVLQEMDCTERIALLAVDENSEHTTLISAVRNGNLDCVKVLLKYGADIEGQAYSFDCCERRFRTFPFERCTPLFAAAAYGYLDILTYLVENGADVNAVTRDFKDRHRDRSYSPLTMAIEREHIDTVKFLVDQGADVNLQVKGGSTALHIAAKRNQHFDALGILINSGRADVNAYSDHNVTPLMIACQWGCAKAVNCLLQNGAKVNLQSSSCGRTALHYALWRKYGLDNSSLRDEIISSLIKNGADVNLRGSDHHSYTPLMLACKEGYLKTATFLIDQGANVDLQDENGDTALHYAQYSQSKLFENQIVSALLNAGASNLCNNKGLTPLLLASNNGNVTVVECIIKQTEITKEQRIDALELLGATLALKQHYSVSTFKFVNKGFMYIKRGMIERFANPSNPLLKQHIEPIEAYQNRTESQTLKQLAKIKRDKDAIIMESLTVRERILGKNNVELLPQIRCVAHYLEKKDFSSFFSLQRRAIKIAQTSNQTVFYDLRAIIMTVWCKWFRLVKLDAFVDWFDQIIRDFEQEIQRAEMKGRGISAAWSLKEGEFLLKLIVMISKVDRDEDGKPLSAALLFLKTLCNFNPRDNDDRNTLFHQFVIQQCRFPSYSYTGAMKLLVNAGFNVNAINRRGNTPLHLAVTFKPTRKKSFRNLTDMLEVLFDGGAHHDFVNRDGKTPLDMAQTDKARMILSKRRKLEVKGISVVPTL